MQINFYIFAKKDNSTKVPTTPSATYECIIKDSCSILSPIINLDTGVLTTQSPVNYNYVYIPDWNRYYFINDWTFSNRLWTASLRVDVLSTYKNDLLTHTPYVLRSSSMYNQYAIDTTYPALASESAVRNSAPNSITLVSAEVTESRVVTSPWQNYFDEGYYYVTVMSGRNSGYSIFVFDWTNYKEFITSVFNLSISIEGLPNDLAKVLVNPIKYVTGVKWCPYLMPGVKLASRVVYVGYNYAMTLNCGVVSSYTFFGFTTNVDIPKHPMASTRGEWCNCSPYAKYTLYFKPFGTFNLNAIDLYNDTSLTISVQIDIRTGDGILKAYSDGSGTRVYHVDTISKFMVDIPVTQSNITDVGLVGLGLSALTNLSNTSTETESAKNNPANPYRNGRAFSTSVLETTKNTLSNIGSALASYGNGMTSSGAFSNFTVFYSNNPTIEAVFLDIAEEDNEHQGKPLMQNRTLNQLSGYVLCKDGEVDFTCTDEEKNIISNYLTGGFFLE